MTPIVKLKAGRSMSAAEGRAGEARRARTPRPRAAAWLAAVAGATAMALAAPPATLFGGWLLIPGFALLIWAFRGLSGGWGAVLGLVAGLVYFGILLHWITVIGTDGWVALTLLCAAFWAATGAVLPRVVASRGALVLVPALWVVNEALRARIPYGGFPWGRLAFTQAGTSLSGWVALGGTALVTFMAALMGMALLLLVAPRRGASRLAARLLTSVLIAAAVIAGGRWVGAAGRSGPASGEAQLAVVQGNVPEVGLDFNARRRAVLANHVTETLRLADRVAAGELTQPDLVLWPENASDVDPIRDTAAAGQITRAAQAIQAPILVGAVMDNPARSGTLLNALIVWDPRTGPGQLYVKRHPVPFGEYLPMRGLLTRFVTRFERIPRDFVAGAEPGVLTVGGVRAGVLFCFEVAYDNLAREAVAAGGEVLLVGTNNATYGQTGQPEQQLAMTRLRARETARETLVAATSGVSAVIDSTGRVRWRAPEGTAASTVVSVPLRAGLTPATRLGLWPELVICAVLPVGWMALYGRRRRARMPG